MLLRHPPPGLGIRPGLVGSLLGGVASLGGGTASVVGSSPILASLSPLTAKSTEGARVYVAAGFGNAQVVLLGPQLPPAAAA